MAYITSTFGNGSIGFVEYSYALNAHFPVVQLRNPAGKYVLPTAANVTTALTRAVINEDAHSRNFLQHPDGVYTCANPGQLPAGRLRLPDRPRQGTRRGRVNFTKAKGRPSAPLSPSAPCTGQRSLPARHAALPAALVERRPAAGRSYPRPRPHSLPRPMPLIPHRRSHEPPSPPGRLVMVGATMTAQNVGGVPTTTNAARGPQSRQHQQAQGPRPPNSSPAPAGTAELCSYALRLMEGPVTAEPWDQIAALMTGHDRLRASDADRERVIDTLETAFVEGPADSR